MIIVGKNGKPITAKQRKAYIMRVQGYKTTKEYEKAYDIFRNRVKNYEAVTGKKLQYSPADLLYLQSRSMTKYGAEYRQSELLKAIEATPSTSTGIVKKKGISEVAEERLYKTRLKAFSSLIKKSKEAQKIMRQQGLSAKQQYEQIERYADTLHEWQKNAAGKYAKKNKDVPFGYTPGTP